MSKGYENLLKEELLKELFKSKNQITQQENQITQKESELIEKENQLTQKESQLIEKTNQITQLNYLVDQLKRLAFGAKRERFIPQDENQQSLPFDLEENEELETEESVVSYVKKKKKRENHPGRIQLSSHLPVEETVLEPQEDTTGLKKVGEKVTEKLEITPAKLYIKR